MRRAQSFAGAKRKARFPFGQGVALYSRLTGDIASGVLRLQPGTDDMERQFGTVLESCFSQVPPVFIRTNDALHLAAARVAGETEFVTADGRQRAAAQLLGFRVLP